VSAVDDPADQALLPRKPLQEWRAQILNWILYGLAFFGVFAVIGEVKLRLDDGRMGYAVYYLLIYAAGLVAAFARRLGFVPRAVTLLGALYGCAIGGFALGGLVNAGPVFLFAAVVMATILFDLRWGVSALLLGLATIGGMGAAFTLGWLEEPPIAHVATPALWFTYSAIFVALGTATVISAAFLLRRLEGSVETSADLVLSLEERVRERERAEEALRASEARLRHSQKLEAMGQLAGGLAHDFNNFLTVIKGYGESLAADLEGEPQRAAREVCEVAERASALTRQLLAFGRRQHLQPQILDLNAVVGELEEMLRRVIGGDVACELALDPSLGRVMADAGQMQQVVLNLSLNARDAMPQGGKLTVRTYESDCSPDYPDAAAGSDPARYVCLSVTDDGCGMDAETRSRIFEPFFTTKDPGQGTGLGLPTVYGIVKQSDGEIRVQSARGQGTTVEILLPRVAVPE